MFTFQRGLTPLLNSKRKKGDKGHIKKVGKRKRELEISFQIETEPAPQKQGAR